MRSGWSKISSFTYRQKCGNLLINKWLHHLDSASPGGWLTTIQMEKFSPLVRILVAPASDRAGTESIYWQD